MRAKTFKDLLKKGDRVAVSNITGREASDVSIVSQNYCGNLVGGWALGKGGQTIDTARGPIRVFATFEELLRLTHKDAHPNKILIYSPPDAVYGEVKEVLKYGRRSVETIFVVTEHVSVEVTAKIHRLCQEADVDVVGCNTLGLINVHDRVRIGAVGGILPEESFQPGSVAVISNSGNMVNTISSYLASEGLFVSFGISTGKDRLILTPLKEFLQLALKDEHTRLIVLYVEPGGVYEYEAVQMMREKGYAKPLVVYVAGSIAERHNISLGHAGAVVEGEKSSAHGKKTLFDEYFGVPAYDPAVKYKKSEELKHALIRGIRVETLHHIPKAVNLIREIAEFSRDHDKTNPLKLNPWFSNLRGLGKFLPSELNLADGIIPALYKDQIARQLKTLSDGAIRQSMRNASKASSNDGRTPRIYGYSVMDVMQKHSFAAGLILYWTGELPAHQFEERLAELTLIASLTNGPGTISAQGAKLSASAGNNPNTAMIGTLASIGLVHGGNGAKAVRFLLDLFADAGINSAYEWELDLKAKAKQVADDFKKRKTAARSAGLDYEKIPCLGHPVFTNDPVNFDPREQVIYQYLEAQGLKNIFLEFYHQLVAALKDNGSTSKVLAVNVDAAIASVWLAICWTRIMDKQMSLGRASDIPFLAFALGRVAGGAGEYLDHRDSGTAMDMRVPVAECRALTRPRVLPGK